MGTLDIMKRMVDCKRIDMEKVTEVLQYWDHENDLPMGRQSLRECYRQLFGNECPI